MVWTEQQYEEYYRKENFDKELLEYRLKKKQKSLELAKIEVTELRNEIDAISEVLRNFE